MTYDDHDYDLHLGLRALGVVPTSGRGSMPFALLDGEPLVAFATHALGAAGAELLDFNAGFAEVRARQVPVAFHDPLCPLVPVEFLREAIRTSADEDAVVVGVAPVTDTIKTVDDGVVGETVDREALWAVTSPVVLPASAVAELDTWPDTDDFAGLVTSLREKFGVRFLEAPPMARRVDDESSLAVLHALAAEHADRAGED